MKELSFADVSRHFHMPLTQAAERLNVSVTLVKRICRENGVSRWPFRKLQSRMKKERIVARGFPHDELAGYPALGAHALAPGASLEIAGVDVRADELLEHYLASLVDFVDSTDAEPLDMGSHDAVFGSMVDQTLEGAYLRGWNSFAVDMERHGGLPAGQPGAGLPLPALGEGAPGGAAALVRAGSSSEGGDRPGGGGGGEGSSEGSLGERERSKLRRARKGKNLSFGAVSRQFHLPLTQAAEVLNVSVTLVKRVCREHGVSRWPFRKLQARMRKEPIQRAPAQLATGPAAALGFDSAAVVSASFWPRVAGHAPDWADARPEVGLSLGELLGAPSAEGALLSATLEAPAASLLKGAGPWLPAQQPAAPASAGALLARDPQAEEGAAFAAGSWRSMPGAYNTHSIPKRAVPPPQ